MPSTPPKPHRKRRKHNKRKGAPRQVQASSPPVLVTGTVERIVPGGLGLLRDEKGVLFCRGGLIGERVSVEVSRKKGGVRHGVVKEVLSPSPHRVAPDCEHHPHCGGCDLLEFDLAARSEAKQTQVEDALTRIGRLSKTDLGHIEPLREAKLQAQSRTRCTLHTNQKGQLGFFARQSHEVVAVSHCAALQDELSQTLQAAQEYTWPNGMEVSLCVDDTGRVGAAFKGRRNTRVQEQAQALIVQGNLCGALVLDNEKTQQLADPLLHGVIAKGACGGPYLSDAATFSQATRFGGQTIAALVKEMTGAKKRVLELFAGAGHLTLSLAETSTEVMAIEGESHAFSWLVENATRSPHAEAITCHQHDIWGGGWDPALWPGPAPDVLVVDPPRTGIADWDTLLRALAPAELVMVSCDVATGARDLATAFTQGYALKRLVPIDAFPRTSHVEWVAHLRGPSPKGRKMAP